MKNVFVLIACVLTLVACGGSDGGKTGGALISPNAGLTTGGTLVTIKGTGLDSVTSVTIGGGST